jgi:ankyrin repeat protein
LKLRKFKLVKTLIQGGEDVNMKSPSGITPLMLVCRIEVTGIDEKKKLDILECLVEHKADLNATDNIGRTALMYAIQSGSKSTIRLLKQHGLINSVGHGHHDHKQISFYSV